MTHVATPPPATSHNHALERPLGTRRGALDYVSYAMVVLAVVFVAFAIVGGVRRYLPIPYWDMWFGYVGFMTRSDLSTWQAWWGQHNEHRILLSRLLFWVDYRLFGASLASLIVVNYVLAAWAAVLFVWALRERIGALHARNGALTLAGLVVVVIFSWLQSENFNWAFQSQFFLAQTVPLAALLALYRAQTTLSTSWFIAAAALGVLACGTMANGVAALPMLVVMAALCGASLRRICLLAVLTVGMLAYYFNDYQSANASRSIEAVARHAVDLIQYTLVYLGGPVYIGTGGNAPAAAGAGLFLAVAAVYFMSLASRRKERDALGIALALFILYVASTALLTALGRYDHGVGQAASSRYQTPTLMAWTALLILSAPWLMRAFARRPLSLAAAALLVPLALLPQQRSALKHDRDGAFERWMAILAIEMGVNDPRQIGFIYPASASVLVLSEPLKADDMAAFGDPILDPIELGVGRSLPADASVSQCRGTIDSTAMLPDAPGFLRIEGRVISAGVRRARTLVQVLDDERHVVGYAFTRDRSTREVDAAGAPENLTHFSGYLAIGAAQNPPWASKVLSLRVDSPRCESLTRLPQSAVERLSGPSENRPG